MPRRKVHRELTQKQKLENSKKRLIVWESEIRDCHAQIIELQDKIVHAECMRDETLREIEDRRAGDKE